MCGATFVLNGAQLDVVVNGLTILGDLSLSFRTDEGTLHQLVPVAEHRQSLPDSCVEFTGDALLESCCLTLAGEHDSCILGCQLSLHQKPFQRNVSFHSIQGVVIRSRFCFNVKRYVAMYRHKDWWSRPAFGNDVKEMPQRTQAFFGDMGELCMFGLALSQGDYVCEFQGGAAEGSSKNGLDFCIAISSYCSGMSSCRTTALACSIAKGPYQAVDRVMALIKERLDIPTYTVNHDRTPLTETLGWCSWDAFYQHVHEDGLLQKAREFKEKNIPVRWMLIDDGWLQHHQNRLTSFEEDPQKFPSGFASLIGTLKKDYGIRHVGVWHAFSGYWGGIDAESFLGRSMSPFLWKSANGTLLPDAVGEGARVFWDQWYRCLRKKGIDFVKVDGQSAITNQYLYAQPAARMAQKAHAALEAAATINFPAGLINCMGMATENIMNRSRWSIARNSDDFVPQDLDGFAEHALQNTFNSMYHGRFQTGDWDMFWTRHPESRNHALLRAIAGGPLYISDPVGQTDASTLQPLVFTDGTVATCDGNPTIARESLFDDPVVQAKPLKVINTVADTTMVACFNITEARCAVDCTVGRSDNRSELDGQQVLIHDVLANCLHEESWSFSLQPGQAALFQIVVAVHGICALGLLSKYVPKRAILWEERMENGLILKVHETGEYGFCCTVPVSVNIHGTDHASSVLVGCDGQSTIFTVQCFSGDIIEIIR
jgi:hypothetical protein